MSDSRQIEGAAPHSRLRRDLTVAHLDLRATGILRPSEFPLLGANIESAGDHNQRIVLHVIRVKGPITRLEIARFTGLAPSSVSIITKRLVIEGLIREAGRIRGLRGQPAINLVINPDSRYAIGLDIDHDHMTLVVLDFLGKVRARSSREVALASPAMVRTCFRGAIGPLLAKAGIGRTELAGIGFALPTGIARAHHQEPASDWGSASLGNLLKDVLDIPIHFANDATAAVLGEMHFGLGRQYRSFFYILLTSAFGGGLVVDGSYFLETASHIQTMGQFVRRGPDADDLSLESIVSVSALHRLFAQAGFRMDPSFRLTRLAPRARELLDQWVRESAEALEGRMVAINCLINPEAILIGARLPTFLLDKLASALNERLTGLTEPLPAAVPIARAAMSTDAAAVGAASLAFADWLLPVRLGLSQKENGFPAQL